MSDSLEKKMPAVMPARPVAEQKKFLPIHEELQNIIRTISGRGNLTVTTEIDPMTRREMAAQGKNPDREWFYNYVFDKKTRKKVKEYVHIPKEIFEVSEDEAMGKAAHEAGHVLITRYGRFVPRELLQKELGLNGLLAAAEERPTDEVVRMHRPAAGILVDKSRKASLAEGEEIEKMKPEARNVPRFMQLGALIVYGPHYEKIPESYSPEVIAAYDNIKEDVKEMEIILPERGAKEKEVMAKAKARYRSVYLKIWPKIKELVQKDIKDEKARQTMRELQKPEEQKALEELMKMLEEKLKEELERLIEDINQRDGQSGQSKLGKGIEFPLLMPISPALLQALDKAFNSLSPEKQRKIIEAARLSLENLEDEMTREMAGKLTEAPQAVHAEERLALEKAVRQAAEKAQEVKQEAEAAERREEIRKELEQRKQQAEFQKGLYERVFSEVNNLIEKTYQELMKILKPNVKTGMKLKPSGSRVNLPALFRWKSARAGGAKDADAKIFESVAIPEKRDYAFSVLIDLSTSMAKLEKLDNAFKALVILMEVMNRLGIKFEVRSFSNWTAELKKMDSRLDNALREKIARSIIVEGQTYLGEALDLATESLDAVAAKHKIIVVLTDGAPSDPGITSQIIQRITAKFDQKLIGLGLGFGTDMVKRYFPVSMPNVPIEDFPQVLAELLKDIIYNPQKYK